ncbi:AAA family ATPase [Clostridium perfringens]|uniref:AAA family ATPase n=1 Tax=Clostridium perfringens TaxID=1502 RepID=UPI001CACDB8A|nr:AAA family ATPase [Clostridium perfringens]MCX0388272.1 AAA family ATPase [Clostridium perfringens]MDU5883428.1 AAA family ATPase [Clostridium perfringens]HBI7118459.1 AAA family ATPase [Clostridium perfringens]HBI7134616.1 AAA family ATPase [Clostridium perfringens]
MNKYEALVLDCASKLDAMVESHGKITSLATSIVENQSSEDTITLLKVIVEIATKKNNAIEIAKMAALLKDSLVRFYGHKRILEICNEKKFASEDDKTLTELLEELNALVGLKEVKEKVNDLIVYQKVQKMRQDFNLHTTKSTLHLAFTGNPGTGKTTVARIVGRIYKKIGLLSKGHFVEVSRTDLIAGYQGQTALKVKSIIDKARGGVLFIDEAYSITENDHADSYGRECLTELTKALEDYRDDLVVIVAGYTEPMNKFFASNPGLKSRFNTFIQFEDYSSKELVEILTSICSANDYKIDKSALKLIEDYFQKYVKEKKDNFANGRMVRNLYDNLVMNHARRVVKIENPKCEELSKIKIEDFMLIDTEDKENY